MWIGSEIIITPGPISGIPQYPGSGNSLMVVLSQETKIPIDSNGGDDFGPRQSR